MEVKGNFIVQGSYIDVHDNEVVNLSVDKAEVKVNDKEVKSEGSCVSTTSEAEEKDIISCIEILMDEKDEDGKYLVSQGNHWIAIYRIVVDKGLGASDADYLGFCNMINSMQRTAFRIPLKQDNLKTISKGNYTRPFDKWKYDTSYASTRKPFDRMVAVAKRFKEILEENGF